MPRTAVFVERTLARTIAALAASIVVLDLLTGGVNTRIAGIRISTRDPFRPFLVLVLALSVLAWLRDREREQPPAWGALTKHASWFAMLIAAASGVAAVHFGVFAAAGADTYGYVSEASLWLSGHLMVKEPLAIQMPQLGTSVAPLGYQLARAPGYIVPIYSPGLPLLMAAFQRVGGPHAVFYVVPVLSALIIWLVYRIGLHLSGPHTGLLAAVAIACSPIFIVLSIGAMSDIPAACWWLVAIVSAWSTRRWAPLGAGLAASAAVLTRPNVAPLLIVLGCMISSRPPRLRRSALFLAGALPGCALVGAINDVLYGAPTNSGYGSLSALFAFESLHVNARHYLTWIFQSYSWMAVLGLLMPLTAWWSGRATDTSRKTPSKSDVGLLLLFIAVLALCYAFYTPYDSWPFLRFLICGVILWIVLCCDVAVSLLDRVDIRLRGAVGVLVVGLLAATYLRQAQRLLVFDVKDSESRCIPIGQYVDRHFPQNALVVTVMQSGSMRLYGHRTTLRWDQLHPDEFDRAIDLVAGNGYEPYILVEQVEEEQFKTSFGNTRYGKLNWPPTAVYRGPVPVSLYRIADRQRAEAGLPVETGVIPTRP